VGWAMIGPTTITKGLPIMVSCRGQMVIKRPSTASARSSALPVMEDYP
jgi:hypothetical protein